MIIGIDISMLVYQGSGVANYTYNMVRHLLLYDKKNEYRLFYSSLRRPDDFYYLDEFKKLGAKVYDFPFPPWLLNIWWNKFHIIPVEWFIGRVDYYFSSDFLRPPTISGTKGITTIHDLTWKIFPEYHTNDIIQGHERKLQKTIKYGDIIITDSQNTKKDLLKYYPRIRQTNKVLVIYPGIDERFRIINDQNRIKRVLKKYGVEYPKRYLLYVGAIEPRKNLDTAIKVFQQLIQDKKYSDFEFLIVGRAGWKNENIFQLVNDLKLNNKINFVGYVQDNDLVYFYNACRVFIYLSKYEGFGLPPLEAATCNKASLLYRNSSLPELFPQKYSFTEKKRELLTLKQMINAELSHTPVQAVKHSWKKAVKIFSDKIS